MTKVFTKTFLCLSFVGIVSLASWVKYRGGAEEAKTAEPVSEADISVYFSPSGTDCQDAIVLQISKAKKSVYCQYYGFDAAPITEAIITAKSRGLDVRVILDQSNLHQHWSHLSRLFEGKVPVYIDSKEPIAHLKCCISDGETVSMGSYNATQQALKNSESLVVIKSKDIAKKYLANFQHHLSHSIEFKGVLP
jgi:phosphatidylserine/phosphatidylglycerophosphate/cardiolipin synthase-like enzyme